MPREPIELAILTPREATPDQGIWLWTKNPGARKFGRNKYPVVTSCTQSQPPISRQDFFSGWPAQQCHDRIFFARWPAWLGHDRIFFGLSWPRLARLPARARQNPTHKKHVMASSTQSQPPISRQDFFRAGHPGNVTTGFGSGSYTTLTLPTLYIV